MVWGHTGGCGSCPCAVLIPAGSSACRQCQGKGPAVSLSCFLGKISVVGGRAAGLGWEHNFYHVKEVIFWRLGCAALPARPGMSWVRCWHGETSRSFLFAPRRGLCGEAARLEPAGCEARWLQAGWGRGGGRLTKPWAPQPARRQDRLLCGTGTGWAGSGAAQRGALHGPAGAGGRADGFPQKCTGCRLLWVGFQGTATGMVQQQSTEHAHHSLFPPCIACTQPGS